MIKSFKDDEVEKVFHLERSKKLPSEIQQIALRKFRMLDAAISLNTLRIPPANRLEKLKGERQGQYSIRINERWRICFEWHQGNAYLVEIVDYH